MGVLTLPLPLTLGQGQSGAFVSRTGPEAPQSEAGGPPQMAPHYLAYGGHIAHLRNFWRKGESIRTSLQALSLTLGWGHFGKQGII